MFAIHIMGASSELACMDNICDNLQMATLPILPQLLSPRRCSLSGTTAVYSVSMEDSFELANTFIRQHQ